MGDRVSVSVIEDGAEPGSWKESIVVKSHWGGETFPKDVLTFLRDFRRDHPIQGGGSTPETRLDPWYIIVYVIVHFASLAPGDISVGRTMEDVDNSDNGHWRIRVPSLKLEGPFFRKGER